MSQSHEPLPAALLQALTHMVEAHAPRNRPMTLAEVEQAVFDLLQQLGPSLTDEVMATQIAEAEKRGSGPSVATSPCAGAAPENARC